MWITNIPLSSAEVWNGRITFLSLVLTLLKATFGKQSGKKIKNTEELPSEEDLPWVSGHLWSCWTFGPALRGVLSEGHTPPEHLSGWSSAGVRDTRVSGPSRSTVCPQSLCYHTVLLGLHLPNSPALSNICQPRDQSHVLGGAAPGKARFQSDPPSASSQGSPTVDKAWYHPSPQVKCQNLTGG